jgi:glycosyltransferase involved in cell wall biosynthesis
MHIAFVADPRSPNAWYRAIGPMIALHARGHIIEQVVTLDGAFRGEVVRRCELLHVHRQHDERTTRLVQTAKEIGVAVVWDNDDDLAAVPREMAVHNREYGGLRRARATRAIQRIVGLADIVTAPSDGLVKVFSGYGARDCRKIENYVADDAPRHASDRNSRGRIVVGWMGGDEHRYDADRMPLSAALRRLLDEHQELEVVTIGGVATGFKHERYQHVKRVRFDKLAGTLAEFTIGLAPLVDMPMNRGRSNVKLKEYASAGVPWLASPVGPYAAMGEKEGGRLVRDDEWFQAIDQLIRKPRELQTLAKHAREWGAKQTISRNVALWERIFADALAILRR